MAESANEVIVRYLEDVIAAESSFETQLRAFAEEGDDDELHSLFAAHAGQTNSQHKRLTARLDQLGGSPSSAKTLLAHVFALTPRAVQATHSPDERIAQNLIVAFAIEQSECAMYESLASVARAAGDLTTERLARDIQAEEREAAAKVWGFIPSRAKIAFNLLTASEVDPAVETRTADNRVF